MIRKSSMPVVFLLALTAILLIATGTASAQVKSFSWLNWDSEITLLENGELQVQETHTLDFRGAPFTYGYRTIETGTTGNNDGIKDISVREGETLYTQSSSGDPNTYYVRQEGDVVTINWYFEPALGQREYVFSYTVEGGVTVDENGDQIFWTIVPDDHPGIVEQSRATITLPEGIQPQKITGTDDWLVAAYYNGEPTEAVDIQVSEDGRITTYTNNQPLLVGRSFEVRNQFPHGLLDISTPGWQRTKQLADTFSLLVLIIALLIGVGGPLLVLLLWYLKGRDPEMSIVVPEYISEPPADLPPAVVGTLVDEKVDMQDIVSTLIDLANRGYLMMTEEDSNHIFTRTDKPANDLRDFEQQFLKDIFRGKDERSLNSLRYKFADKLPGLRTKVYNELVTENLVPKSPHYVRTSYGCLSVVIFAIAGITFIGLTVLFGDYITTAICPALAIILTGIAMVIASRHMPRKTLAGTEEAAKWNAFKNYLKNIENYKNLEESSEIFSTYLGYAVAFGLERTWIRKFSTIPSTPIPPWYIPYPYYGGMYRAGRTSPGRAAGGEMGQAPSLEGMSRGMTGGLAAMSAGLTRMLNSSSTVLKSTQPSSSSGSGGSFSGGFSGGFSAGGGGSAGFG